ncbi:hypothetical protein GCM10022226_71110 [Sphaerisporangium flaviroseum]|uniref:Uncharacterized protein n=1 Tax=Sphaerisporangium flaviroseum TaxID=509199 RepID=A0ABP7JAN7_9ACTN
MAATGDVSWWIDGTGQWTDLDLIRADLTSEAHPNNRGSRGGRDESVMTATYRRQA